MNVSSAESLTPEEAVALTALSARRTWGAILGDYAVIGGAVALVALISDAAVIALAVLLVARQQHALAILIHEGVHYRLFRSKPLNDFVARFLLSAPLFLSYEGYRRTHLDHHRYTMTARDPDLRFVSGFPISKRRFSLSLLADCVGISYSFVLLHYYRQALAAARTVPEALLAVVPGIGLNGAALAGLWVSGYGMLYLVCWVIPMFCVLPLFLHLRGILEHGGHKADRNPMNCTWTVINGAQTFFIAPHHINYHVEHHGYPAVPHFNLPKLHVLLRKRGVLPMRNVRSSYASILRPLLHD
jgi:fatty acid desaturase